VSLIICPCPLYCSINAEFLTGGAGGRGTVCRTLLELIRVDSINSGNITTYSAYTCLNYSRMGVRLQVLLHEGLDKALTYVRWQELSQQLS
jgi:hypothetical protein